MKRVLILEDEPIIALDLASARQCCRLRCSRSFDSIEGAISALRESACSAAILDINIAGRNSAPVAGELKRQDRPFLALSGYHASDLAPEFQGIDVFAKPADLPRILKRLSELTAVAPGPREPQQPDRVESSCPARN